ncbi:MAG: DUF2071 domain-containing protein [Acidimicrobiaceae bacterium]|nr:DUF2071 domain-containing protein [Acidimicrobiaceae bacterium]
MRHRWESVTFLHWAYPIDVVRRHLPAGMEIEPWDGQAWVSIVLFRMHVLIPVGASWHVVPAFPETNVRTYVVGPDGERGIWFLSLDAGSPSAVLGARAGYGLPYYWAAMRIDQRGESIRYMGTRRWPPPRGMTYDIAAEGGDALLPEMITPFDHYLTARFTLWNRYGRLLLRTDVVHPPWPLRTGRVLDLRQELLGSHGLPVPGHPPLVHVSDGVDVRIAAPRTRFVP